MRFLIIYTVITFLFMSDGGSNASPRQRGEICDNLIGDTVDCSGQNFKSVPQIVVDNASGVTKVALNLAGNDIRRLKNDVFAEQIPNGLIIDVLALYFCNMVEIETHAFQGLTELKVLGLSDNLLQDTDDEPLHMEQIFKPLIKLVALVLSGNPSIRRIRANSFKYLRNLRHLELSRCGIATIEARALANLVNLQYLILMGNQLTGETLKEAFSSPPTKQESLRWLKSVRLDRNPLKRIYNHSFCHFEYALELALSECAIQTIENDAFSDFRNLETLDLSGNNLSDTPPGPVFVRQSSSLQMLNLDRNPIKRIRNDSFTYTRNINKLDLSSCQIQVVERGAFQPLTSYELTIDLRNNLFDRNQMAELGKLVLARKSAKILVENVESEISIRIDNWRDGIISCDLTTSTSRPTEILFYNFEYQLANSAMISMSETKREGDRLTRTMRIGNFSSCLNCKFHCETTTSKIEEKVISPFDIQVGENYGPPAERPNVVFALPTTFTVNPDLLESRSAAVTFICVANCVACHLKSIPPKIIFDDHELPKPANYLIHVDFSQNDFPKLKKNIFANEYDQTTDDRRTLSYVYIIHLFSCKIEVIEPGAFAALTNLTVLNLDSNKLTTVPDLADLPNLIVLTLAENLIEYIDGSSFSSTTKLVRLDLHGCKIRFISGDAFDSLNNFKRLKEAQRRSQWDVALNISTSPTFTFEIVLAGNDLENNCYNFEILKMATQFPNYLSIDDDVRDDMAQFSKFQLGTPRLGLSSDNHFKDIFQCSVDAKTGSETLSWYWKMNTLEIPLTNSFVTSISSTPETRNSYEKQFKVSSTVKLRNGYPCNDCDIELFCTAKKNADETGKTISVDLNLPKIDNLQQEEIYIVPLVVRRNAN